MRYTATPIDLRQFDREQREQESKLLLAAAQANDLKSKQAHQRQRSVMASAQLGGLTKAVKLKLGRSRDRGGSPNAYGVIYAADGDESRAGQALQAYSRGTTIRPVRGPWLWYQTPALARTSKVPGDTKRARLTPERYKKMGSPLGPLKFARITARFAKLYVENADVSVKSGRASLPGKRQSRTKVRTKRVTIFFGIKNTRRAQRYDPQRIVAQSHGEIPLEIARLMGAAGPAAR